MPIRPASSVVCAFLRAKRSTPRIARVRQTLPRSRAILASVWTIAGFSGLVLSGCSTSGEPMPVPSSYAPITPPEIRQIDDEGRQLPFRTTLPNRWSINNNGTGYEPCTQVPEDVVARFGFEPATVKDAAASDFQTARGCTWISSLDRRSSLSQIVGNILDPQDGLSGYKKLHSPSTTWFPDGQVHGRRVLVGSTMRGECAVIVQSGDAVVVSSITRVGPGRPPADEVCADVTAFASATIGRIPQ
ncbi:DUF3558 domain-containing protein [Gordonia sp. (in: high G+C Gram-positive bacteria)]|uniref:DUF3558 domain-containing protein n=1 Tax=Gordonia sp. (in: high G+C Gram-positive bacteria) TaxID=84139 RepID=UPI0035B39E43